MLFLIHINSIPESMLKGKLFIFADDIAYVNVEDNWGNLKQIVEWHLYVNYISG